MDLDQGWVQILGTLVTIAGLVVVAPRAAGRVLPSLWRAVAHAVAVLRRRPVTGHLNGTVPAMSSGSGSIRVNWSAQASGQMGVEERIARLERALKEAEAATDNVRKSVSELDARLAGRLSELEGHSSELQRRVQEAESKQEQLNTRGFPLTAAGALLAGVPWWFASWWWLPLHLLVTVLAFVGLRQSWGEVKEGWKEAAAPNRP